MGKTADIVAPGTSASHPATYECAWGKDWHVLTGRVFDTTWPAGSGPRQVGQTSSPSLVPSSSRLPTGTTAGAALQDEDGPRRRSPPAGPPSPGTRRACLPHHRRSRRCDGGGRGQDDTLADNRRHAPGSPSFHPTCPADLPSRDLPIEVAFTFAGAASAGQSGPPTTTASPASSPLLQLPLDARAEDGAGHHRDSVSRILRPPPHRALNRPTRPSRQGIRTGDLVKREHFLYGEALFLPATPQSNTHTPNGVAPSVVY